MKINNATLSINLLLITACGFILQSYASVRTIQANEITHSNQPDISIFTKDGRTTRLDRKSYHIDSSQSDYLIVRDVIYNNDLSIISYSQIDSIQIREFSSLSSGIGLGIVVVGSTLVALLILGWIYGPISIG